MKELLLDEDKIVATIKKLHKKSFTILEFMASCSSQWIAINCKAKKKLYMIKYEKKKGCFKTQYS